MKDIINEFVEGAVDGVSGNKSNPGNLKIKENQMIHFNTPILERNELGYIINMTRYSIQTGRLQKLINELITEDLLIVVLRVPMDYKGSLSDFIKE
jgi:hypothetical protein